MNIIAHDSGLSFDLGSVFIILFLLSLRILFFLRSRAALPCMHTSIMICLRSHAALPCTRRSRDRLTVRMRMIYSCGQCVPVQCAPTRATKKSAKYIKPNAHCILATSSANSSFKKRVQILPYKKSCRLKKGLLIWGPTFLCSPKYLLLTLLTLLISPWKKPHHF